MDSVPATPDARNRTPAYLLAAWCAVDMVLGLLALVWDDVGPYLSLLLAGQFVVLTGWLVVGDGWRKTTLAALGLVCVLSLFTFGELLSLMPLGAATSGLLFALSYGVLVNVPLILAATFGWRLAYAAPRAGTSDRLLQFSLREFLIYTAMLAMLAAAWAESSRPSEIPPRAASEFIAKLNMLANVPRTTTSTQQAQAERRLFAAALVAMFAVPWSLWLVTAWVRPIRAAPAGLLLIGFWWLVLGRAVGLGNLAYLPLLPAVPMLVHLQALRLAGFGWRRRYGIDWDWMG